MSGEEPMASDLGESIAVLRALAPTLSEDQLRFLLESCNGNVELALAHIDDLGGQLEAAEAALPGADGMHAAAPRGTRRAQAAPAPATAPATTAGRAFSLLRGLAMRTLRLPSAAINTGLGLVVSSVSLGLAVAGFFGDRLLPARMMTSLRGALATLAPLPEDLDPASQARRFVLAFKAAYGDRHPRWVEAGFRQAITLAKTEYKFVFVYMHSPEHQDTDSFCTDVLCSPELVSYVNEQFVSWGGDIRYPDAFHMSSRLSVTRYPYVALLNTTPSNQVQLLAAIQGETSAQALMGKLVHAVERHGAVLIAQRAELQEREYARRLREEQNFEYEQSLAADREREAKRQQQRQQEEQLRWEKEEAERRARAAEEAEQQRKADLEQAIVRRREEKRASLPAEPLPSPSAGGGGSEPLTALVRLRLPDGGSTQRRFLATHRMHHIFDLVDSLDSTNFLKYNLVSSYPRRVFTREEADLSLQEAGLAPQAALFVQPEEID